MEHTRLIPPLFVELHRAEHSTHRHAMRDAKLVGNVPPGTAMRVIAAHANLVLDDLPALAKERGVSLTTPSGVVGDAFAYLRDVVTSPFVDLEHSYLATLSLARGGIDLVRLLRTTAFEEGDDALVVWCDRWLPARSRLVREATDELTWFARNPTFARRHVMPILGAKPVAT